MSSLHNLKPDRVIKAFERAGWKKKDREEAMCNLQKKEVLIFCQFQYIKVNQ